MNSYYNNYSANNQFNNQFNNQSSYQREYDINPNQNTNNNSYENKSLFQSHFKKNFNSFENIIYKEISQCGYQVLSKKEIENRYGIMTNQINNMILGPNFIVMIQNKWNETYPSSNDITNFINTTKQIGQLENKCSLAIYIISKLLISLEAQYIFERENLSPVNRFISIYSTIQSEILYELQKILYSYEIYYFEPDGCVEMLY